MFGDLKSHVEKCLEFWKVPGVAISIVKDGEVVLAEGYGYKDLENKIPMTPDTIMPIGSATKSFTAMTAAMLVEEGKASWDAPASDYIPGFRMSDPIASSEITLKDMLCHRGGMPRHDLMWISSNTFTREDLIRRVRYLKNNVPFRSKAQYQNHMFATVGLAVEKITGKPWEEFAKERILEPLGMKNSNFCTDETQKTPNYALPYKHNKEGEIVPANFMNIGAAGPAGNINSTVNEMTRWLKLALACGEFDGKELVKKETWAEMTSPIVHLTELPWKFDEAHFTSYGLGWFMDVYRGQKVVQHGGNVTGFTALVSTIPAQNIGICILTNMSSTFITYAIQNEIYDRLLGAPETDWNTKFKTEYDNLYGKMKEAEAKTEKDRLTDTKPSHDAEAFLGTYEHPGYGMLKIVKSAEPVDGRICLEVDLNGRAQSLIHYHYNHFQLTLLPMDMKLLARFNIGADGEIESIGVPFEASIGEDIVFVKANTSKE